MSLSDSRDLYARADLLQRVSRTPREQHLFDKYLGTQSSPTLTAPSSSSINTILPVRSTSSEQYGGSRRLESSDKLLGMQRALSEREIQLAEMRALQLRSAAELSELRASMETALRTKEIEVVGRDERINHLQRALVHAGESSALLEQFRSALAEKEREILRLRGDHSSIISAKDRSISELERQIERQGDVVKLLQRANDDHKQRLRILESVMRKSPDHKAPGHDSLQRVLAECDRYKRTIGEQTERIRSLEAEILALDKLVRRGDGGEASKLRLMVEEKDLAIARLQAQKECVSESTSEFAQQIEDLRSQVRLKDIENKFLKERLENVASSRADLIMTPQRTLPQSPTPQRNLSSPVILSPAIGAEQSLQRQLNEELIQTNRGVQQKLDDALSRVRDREDEVAGLQKELNARDRALTNLQLKLSQSEVPKECLKCSAMAAQIRELESFQGELAVDNETLRKQNAELRSEADSVLTRCHDALSEAETAKAQLAAVKNSSVTEKKQTMEFLQDVDSLIKGIRSKMDGSEFGTISVFLGPDENAAAEESRPAPDMFEIHSSVRAMRAKLTDYYADRLGNDCATQ